MAYRTRVDPAGPIVQAGQGRSDAELAELPGTWLAAMVIAVMWLGVILIAIEAWARAESRWLAN